MPFIKPQPSHAATDASKHYSPWWILPISALLVLGLYAAATHSPTATSERNRLASQNAHDGSVLWVERYLKQHYLKDPDSYQSIDWGRVQKTDDGKLQVRHKFRARNSFGGYVVDDMIFTFSEQGNIYTVQNR